MLQRRTGPASLQRALATAAALLLAAPGQAQPPEGAPSLITAAGLQSRMGEPSVVLLHVGDADGYRTAHIPGARHVTPALLSTPRGEGRLTLELPAPEDLRVVLGGLGISNRSTIIVYHAGDWVSQATRVVFTLDYAGLGGQTRLLDGGLAAWRAAGQPVTDAAEPPALQVSDLVLRPRSDAVIGFDEMKALAGVQSDRTIVDARAADFYSGANDRRGEIPRPGHVPGSVNLPYTDFFTPAAGGDVPSGGAAAPAPRLLKPRAELEDMLAAAGITTGRRLVVYCHIGQQATVPFLVARMLGYDVRLYDGSFEQWSATATVAVEK
jgi:thiosulfate/3-mercaptopyruvate sulfurtransferase